MDIFSRYSIIGNHLMDHTFKDLTQMILRVGIFPTFEVMDSCSRYLELHMLIALKVIHKGYVTFIRMVEHILASSKRQFFDSSGSRVEPEYFPFGEKLGNPIEYQAWASTLKVGDEVDAVKFCKHDTRGIWSRAIIKDIAGSKVFVKFHNDNSKLNQHRYISLTPFMVNKSKTRSLDFEAREAWKKGDHVDIFCGRKGWLYFAVTDSKETQDTATEEAIKTIDCTPSGYDNDIYSSDEETGQLGRTNLSRHGNQCP